MADVCAPAGSYVRSMLHALATQPYEYRRREPSEPDWRRLPGWRDVTERQWRDPRWQRTHCIRNVRQLHAVTGGRLGDAFYDDLAADQVRSATMSLLLPPQMLNTMVPETVADGDAMRADPVRRYMLPLASDRRPDWPSHPYAMRDSLHEAEMWVVEGLTHRYPTKVLAEVVPTCPQYCGHCTRMDLVGPSTEQVAKSASSSAPRTAASRSSRTCAPRRRSATSSSPAGTSPTCPGRAWRRSSTGCWRSTTSATSGWLRRRSSGCRSTGSRTTSGAASSAWRRPRRRAASASPCTPTPTPPSRSRRSSPRPAARCWRPACATCATRASCCAASTTPPTRCSTSASRCSTAPA